MAATSVLSLSGHMERTNTVVVLHMEGAKKNVVYFPGDTQVSNARQARDSSAVTTVCSASIFIIYSRWLNNVSRK